MSNYEPYGENRIECIENAIEDYYSSHTLEPVFYAREHIQQSDPAPLWEKLRKMNGYANYTEAAVYADLALSATSARARQECVEKARAAASRCKEVPASVRRMNKALAETER